MAYYSQNYAGILGSGLALSLLTAFITRLCVCAVLPDLGNAAYRKLAFLSITDIHTDRCK